MISFVLSMVSPLTLSYERALDFRTKINRRAKALLFFFQLVVTAAGEEDDGKDDEPDPVVVEQIAEAVIHNRSSKKILR